MDVICECPHKWVGRVRGKASLWLGKGARVVELLLSQLADISKAAYPLPLQPKTCCHVFDINVVIRRSFDRGSHMGGSG